MASLSWWTWVWVSSGSWWWTGKPGVLQSMGSQRVKHDWATELNFNHYVVPSLSLVTVFVLKSVMSEHYHSSFVMISVCMEYLFPSPHFQSEVGLLTAYTRSCFCIHSASLYLLADAFIPFTFKAFINRYAPVTIFLIIFICFVCLFLLLHFLPREVPLAFAIRLIWWCWILLTFSWL